MRKNLKRSVRFSIFKRDSFTCQYCGSKPPTVILHVDHIVSVADGGGDEEENLVTSCRDCNLGKGARSISKAAIGKSLKAELSEMKERQEQLQAYYEFVRQRKAIVDKGIAVFEAHWTECSGGRFGLSESGLNSIRFLLKRYDADMIFRAMEIAWEAGHVSDDGKFPYMCGVLKKLKERAESDE